MTNTKKATFVGIIAVVALLLSLTFVSSIMAQDPTATPAPTLPAGVVNRVMLDGAQIFQTDESSFEVYGDCEGDACLLIAQFNTASLTCAADVIAAQSPEMATAEATEAVAEATEAPADTAEADCVTLSVVDMMATEEATEMVMDATAEATMAATTEVAAAATAEATESLDSTSEATDMVMDQVMDTLVGQNFTSPDDLSDWWVTVYFVGTSSNGAQVYQVNVYDENSTLVDDGALIFVNADGTAALEAR